VSQLQFAGTKAEAPEGAQKIYVRFSDKADFLANLNAIYDTLDANTVGAAIGISAFSFSDTQPFPNRPHQ